MSLELHSVLKSSFESFKNAIKNGSDVIIVTGNESADMDSVASAILFAYYETISKLQLGKNPKYSHIPIVPMIDIPKDEMRLRPDINFVLNKVNILLEKLFLYSDDISLNSSNQPTILSNVINDSSKIHWVLVDHNKISSNFENLLPDSNIISLIDHHILNPTTYDPSVVSPQIIEKTSSCSSLVSIHFKNYIKSIIDEKKYSSFDFLQSIAILGLAPLLLDTWNMLPKTQQYDEETLDYYKYLLSISSPISTFSSDSLFESLVEKKYDLDQFTLDELLRKDYKLWTNNLRIGFSSIVKPLSWLYNHAEKTTISNQKNGKSIFDDAVHNFAKTRHLDAYFVLTDFGKTLNISSKASQNVNPPQRGRQIVAYFSKTTHLNFAIVEKALKKASYKFGTLPLNKYNNDQNESTFITSNNEFVIYKYRQTVMASRKKIAPFFLKALEFAK